MSASSRAKRSDSWWGRDRPVASVALAASSSSRCAISGTAYVAVSTSPCSVLFRRPPAGARGQREDRAVGGAAPAAHRAAAAVEEAPAHAVAGQDLGEAHLGGVG